MAAFLTAPHCVTKSTPIYFVPQIILYHGNLNQTRAPGSHLEEGDRVGVLGVGGNPCGCAGQEKPKQPTCRLHKAELHGKTTDSKCTTRLEGQGYTKPQKNPVSHHLFYQSTTRYALIQRLTRTATWLCALG